MNCSTTAGPSPSSAGHSRTAADTGWACCSSAVPGAAHSRVGASAAAAAAVWTVLSLQPTGSAVAGPASGTTIPTGCCAGPQWDSRLDYVAPATTTNGLGSFGTAGLVAAAASAAVVVVVAVAVAVIAVQVTVRKYYKGGDRNENYYRSLSTPHDA